MDPKQKRTFLSVIKSLLLLAVGALWAICLRLVLSLPDPLAITVLVIIVLVCMLVLVTNTDAEP